MLIRIKIPSPCHQLKISLPRAKKIKAVAVENAETKIFPKELIMKAERRRKKIINPVKKINAKLSLSGTWIPRSCEHCVSDLLEHRVLNLVIH